MGLTSGMHHMIDDWILKVNGIRRQKDGEMLADQRKLGFIK
jgi:hypothetical protein